MEVQWDWFGITLHGKELCGFWTDGNLTLVDDATRDTIFNNNKFVQKITKKETKQYKFLIKVLRTLYSAGLVVHKIEINANSTYIVELFDCWFTP